MSILQYCTCKMHNVFTDSQPSPEQNGELLKPSQVEIAKAESLKQESKTGTEDSHDDCEALEKGHPEVTVVNENLDVSNHDSTPSSSSGSQTQILTNLNQSDTSDMPGPILKDIEPATNQELSNVSTLLSVSFSFMLTQCY